MANYFIELQALPNQEFSITVNNINMTANLRASGDNDNYIMMFSLQINNEYVCPDVPVFAEQGLLPYKYMISEAGGNFSFETNSDNYPQWEDFGKTCFLYFITEDEIYN